MNICFFTDEKATKFHPLTLTRPLDDLRVGIFTVREKWKRALGAISTSRISPIFLRKVFSTNSIDEETNTIWINSRFLPSEKTLISIRSLKVGQRLIFDGETIAANLNGKTTQEFYQNNSFDPAKIEAIEIEEAIHIENLWSLLSLNAYEIEKDIPLTGMKPVSENSDKAIFNPENTYVGEGVDIEPGAIIIAKDGPVVLQDDATIEAGSIIKGPVVIGEGATVKMAARIYGGTTIGPACKVGGEVSNCIFHSYSNKGHDGFVGNSIFGQWVNLGADTNTSNLKNNYSAVRLADWETRKEVETGAQFLGTIMGDHSKTAINTMLNTGTICGVSSNIFMSGFPPKYIPSFSWVGSIDYGEYQFDKALNAMQAMMKRRGVNITDAYKEMMHYHYKNR